MFLFFLNTDISIEIRPTHPNSSVCVDSMHSHLGKGTCLRYLIWLLLFILEQKRVTFVIFFCNLFSTSTCDQI